MSQYPYEYYVDIVTKQYFHGVDNFEIGRVLDCFHKDAVLQVMTSNTLHDGIDAINMMFTGLFETNSRIWHGNFVHTVDIKRQSICSQFSVEVTPHGEDLLRYENCNRFYLEDDKYKRVYVYMSGENLLK